LPRSAGRVRIRLANGSIHTGHFRTDILSANAVSVYFFGDAFDMSLPIDDIDSVEQLAGLRLAS
jgi:hypothetical protein